MSVRRYAILVAVLVAVLAAVPPVEAAKEYRAERFHSRVVVEPGGALVVTETIRFVFGPDRFTYVFRELPGRRTDGVLVLQAMMDGVPMEQGKQAGQFEITKSDGGRRRIVWHFAPTSNAAHTFAVTYRAAGVVWQDAGRDVLAWTLLPTRHEYLIECASGEIEYPESARLLGDARLDPAATESQVEGRAVRFLRCPFERDRTWVVEMDFAPGTVAVSAPAWQERAQRNRQSAPLFLGLAGMILFAGIGGFVLMAVNQRQPAASDAGAALAPPDNLSPAPAGALLRAGASVAWPDALGGILDLARRGVIRIESVAGHGLLGKHTVQVMAGTVPQTMAPHERVLLDLLFTGKSGPRTRVTFSELAQTFASSRRWKRLREAVADELRSAALLDPERERTRGRVTVVGLSIMLSAIAGLIASVSVMDRFGDPVLVLPAALFIVGIAGLITGSTLSTLSDEGQRRAGRWREFRRTLAAVSGKPGGSEPRAEQFEHWLPYATAFGTAMAWAKRLEKQGVVLGPSWLSAVAREGAAGPANIAATIAVLSAGSSAGAHAGGSVAGAGAAGGGASGAG